MRRLPWHVSLRADRRALLTSLGISLGVAFCVLGFTLASALEGEAISEEGRFATPDAIVSRGGDLFPRAAVATEDALSVLLLPAHDEKGGELLLAAVEGKAAPVVATGDARPGRDASVPGGPIVVGEVNATLNAGPAVYDAFVGPRWLLLEPSELRGLAGVGPGLVTYVLVPGMSADEQARLEAEGYHVDRAPGVEPFYTASAVEISRTLLLLVVFAAGLVALFTHEFLRTEIRERRRELGLWRSVGMSVPDVATLLIVRGAFIVVVGTAVGILLALLALAGAARAVDAGIFQTAPPPLLVVLLFFAFLVAGVVGSALPALTEARRDVREWLEDLV